MDTLNHIAKRFKLDLSTRRLPIEIPGTCRNDLPKLFDELGFKVGVEVGVEVGAFSEVILSGSLVSLYCVDAWQAYPEYKLRTSQAHFDYLYAETQKRLVVFNSRCELIKKFSLDAVKDFKPKSIDFVYIDANHELPYVVNDLVAWSKIVRPGGIIAGHDYYTAKNDAMTHVMPAVHAVTDAYGIRPWFILGAQAKEEGVVRDQRRSYMWVKS
jgi:hypothetical protein